MSYFKHLWKINHLKSLRFIENLGKYNRVCFIVIIKIVMWCRNTNYTPKINHWAIFCNGSIYIL